ncbi:MAG: family 43 glycosylhydrolase [Clostridia bacterium]|nr:family 43 glycosylhydrolase [Clostridia bacterium]
MRKLLQILLCIALMGAFILPPVCVDAAEMEMRTVYVSSKGNDDFDGSSYATPVATLSRAIRLCYDGGTIVLCGPIKTTGSFIAPVTVGHITITSKQDEFDYGKSNGAMLSLGGNFFLRGDYTFRDIKIETTTKNVVIVCAGNRVVFDTGITCTTKGANLPSITGGEASNYNARGARLTVNSGSWLRLRGGNRGTGGSKDGTYIEINGGSFSSVVECGGESDSHGDVYMAINGGTFTGAVRITGSTDIHGNVNLAISGGTLKTVKLSEGGKINGNVFVAITAKSGSYSFPKANVTGNLSILRSANQSVTGGGTVTTDSNNAQTQATSIASVINTRTSLLEKERDDAIDRWYKSFEVEKKGECSIGEYISAEDSFELISHKGEQTPVYGTAAKIAGLCIGVVAFVAVLLCVTFIFKGRGVRALSLCLCFVSLSAALLLYGCGEGETQVTTDGVSDTAPSQTTTDIPVTTDAPNKASGIACTCYGNAETVANGIKIKMTGPSFVFADKKLSKDCRVEFDMELYYKGRGGVFVPATVKDADGGISVTGYYLELDVETQTLSLYYITNNVRTLIGQKNFPVVASMLTSSEREIYNIVVEMNTKTLPRMLAFYVNYGSSDEDPYPQFEIIPDKKTSGTVGFACIQSEAYVSNITVSEEGRAPESGLTYTNPIITGMTDPEMFYHEGTYYLYGTRTTDNTNLYCYTSKDGVNFTDAGIVMHGKDVWGDKVFKAANILYHDGYFYMFYLANPATGDAREAYAYSESPLGPFVSDTKEPLYGSNDWIGGQPFVDDDGKIYLVHVRFGKGNETWIMEIECEKGKVTPKYDKSAKLLEATAQWENAIASVVECGYIIKHDGYYYLLYSGGNYNSTYGMGYATSKNVMGPYTRYRYNPILVSNEQAYGVGAASIFPSPDGTEYFIAYLCHSSSSSVRPLNTCIDRIKFVDYPWGEDKLVVYGPTVTPQPAPSDNGKDEADPLDRFQSK